MSTVPPNEPYGSPLYGQTGYTPPLTPAGGAHSAGGTSSDTDSSAKDAATVKAGAAKEQATQVAGDAKDAASNVAGAAKEQAGQVASEVTSQAKDLYGQATSQLKEQAGTQSQKVSEGLRSISDELSSMAEKSDGNGLASELVRNLSGRAGSAASWLDGRDPGSLLDEVKHFAARKPGTFIAIAAGAGLLAGRLTKALTADAKSDTPSSTTQTDSAHSPVTEEPAVGYERTAEQFGDTPVEAGTAHVAATPTFDDIVADRPFGEQR
ncbi:hypothetical protein EDF46_3492 [Frondihabitans sp. PhB188]|uniref:hypothetical protein n=1 Tax=Frondihabitans sp. PhB188 TaxID=2485200 RepID=UPI000F47E078|nr:hypothetical protein [Frondihabitans sp. PhB188]ROQ30980.1 hypothetical protein EDF46_3492 [Frondihabitans sp. PhB188]